MAETSTQISSVIASLGYPQGVVTGAIPAVEDTPEYAEAMRRQALSRLRKAGLRGAYLDADSPEGRVCYERFRRGMGSYLCGKPGRGKTYAASCCVRLAVEDGHRCRLTTAKALLDAVKAEWDGGERDVLKKAERYELLVLDDLGMERATEWAMETISGLIDSRVADGLPTIFTSNYRLGQLRELWGGVNGARLVSRIGGACDPVEMEGPDRRLERFRKGVPNEGQRG